MRRLKNCSPRVLVVGDVMLDHYLVGGCSRISPEAPVPVVDVKRETTSLGGSGNVVNNLLALGAQVTPAAVIGDDDCGCEVLQMLRERGLPTHGVIVESGRTTPKKTRVVVAHQQVVRFDRESAAPIDAATEAALEAAVLTGAYDAVVISDYNKGLVTPGFCRRVIAFAQARGIPVLVDPKGRSGEKYRGATLITPNKREAAELTGLAIRDDADLLAAGEKLRRELDLQYAIITLSEDGIAIFDGGLTKIQAAAKEVYDVSGAGDTVLAVLGFALACGESITEAASLANTAAGIVVGKFGSATVTLAEIEEERFAAAGGYEQAIQSADEIEETAQRLRSAGRKVVFTNGCFDLLHRGHIEYLQASRACGDVLIVGLNTDACLKRLKGPSRPIVPEDDRAAILAALACVDYVVPFDEDTPYELIRRVRPDVLTKGADYTREQVVGHDLVADVRLISLVQGRSTTRTIERIRRAA